MDHVELQANCERCAALCCVALWFDHSAWFSIDKPAGVACPHLAPSHGCAIHSEREARGFAGCVHYDCAGAGQRVTQELFGGRSWRDEPALREPMQRAFRSLRDVHELLVLLHAAAELLHTPEQAERRSAVLERLRAPAGWTLQSLDALDVEAVGREVASYLRSLRGAVASSGARRLPVLRLP